MKIVLCGVQTINKGAELMLYAILQEIERKFPDAIVYLPDHLISQPISYFRTSLNIRKKPIVKIRKWLTKFKIKQLLKRLGVNDVHFQDSYAIKKADFFLDGSGFHFSDQFNINKHRLLRWQLILKRQKKQGTKIVFLPQAFGPVNNKSTQMALAAVKENADLVMPRETVSYNYLRNAGFDDSQLRLYPDFTSLVKGTFPKGYEHLKGAICIIPNKQMINKGVISQDKYVNLLINIIEFAQRFNRKVYLLNHEGKNDEELAYICQKKIGEKIEVVTGLDALDVKGLIATSYLCISSRYHGVASALSSCVPCLATSWSHKYVELYKDYGQKVGVLPINDTESILQIVQEYMSEKKNKEVRQSLLSVLPQIQANTLKMWNEIWSL